MQGLVVVHSDKVRKVYDVKGYIEMRLRRFVDRLDCRLVDGDCTTVIFQVRTKRTRFDEISRELNKLYPGMCVCLCSKDEKAK